MPARSLPAHGRAVSEPRSALTLVAGQEPGDRDRGGALSLGYFSLGKQREVTRSPGWRVEKHRDVFSRKPKGSKQKQMDPGFRRDDGIVLSWDDGVVVSRDDERGAGFRPPPE